MKKKRGKSKKRGIPGRRSKPRLRRHYARHLKRSSARNLRSNGARALPIPIQQTQSPLQVNSAIRVNAGSEITQISNRRLAGLILAALSLNVAPYFLYLKEHYSITVNTIVGDAVKTVYTAASSQMPQFIFSTLIFTFLASIINLGAVELKKEMKKDKQQHEEIVMALKQKIAEKNPNETDMDVLYNALKTVGKISLNDIAKAFDVKMETVEEWCKILEMSNLAAINYSAFGSAELVVKNG